MKVLNNHKKRRELDINLSEALVLDMMSRDWCYMSKSAIGKLIGMNDETTRRVVKRLIKKGYIESKPIPNYKERKKIRLSKKYLDSLE